MERVKGGRSKENITGHAWKGSWLLYSDFDGDRPADVSHTVLVFDHVLLHEDWMHAWNNCNWVA